MGGVIFVAITVSAGISEMGIPLGNILAACTALVLMDIVFGTVALCIGALTGRGSMALGITAALAVAAFLANNLGPMFEGIESVQKLSPFYYYLDGYPLRNGFDVGGISVLVRHRPGPAGRGLVGHQPAGSVGVATIHEPEESGILRCPTFASEDANSSFVLRHRCAFVVLRRTGTIYRARTAQNHESAQSPKEKGNHLMQKQTRSPLLFKTLVIAIALVQLFDIVIHVATDQLEPLRVASNLIILLWLAVALSGRFNMKSMLAAGGALGGYVILNGLFLALEGVTNPAQGGALRTTLFVLIGLTGALSIWLVSLSRGRKAKQFK